MWLSNRKELTTISILPEYTFNEETK